MWLYSHWNVHMLKYTFCGMGGIGPDAERRLWANGILSWNDYRRAGASFFSRKKHLQVLKDIDEADYYLHQGTSGLKWFLKKLPMSHRSRLRPHVLNRCLYIDIETTGLEEDADVTVLTISNGLVRLTFIRGIDLEQCKLLLSSNCVFVTFNGRRFDIPRVRKALSLPLLQPNIDLQPICKACGFVGGQKKCERVLGINRSRKIAELLGKDAVHFWQDYLRGDKRALGLLCEYNQADVIGLEKLFLTLYNESMKGFPWM